MPFTDLVLGDVVTAVSDAPPYAFDGKALGDQHHLQSNDVARIASGADLEGASAVWAAVERESRLLDGRGRVLVRSSGTEPLVRVMAEAPTDDEVEGVCQRLAEVGNGHLGAESVR